VKRRDPAGNEEGRANDLLYRTTPLWCLLIVYWPWVIFSSLNIGHRHLTPLYPAIFILCGVCVHWRVRAARLLWIVCFLVAWHVVESLLAHPDYLAYFNPTVGRRNAYRHLVDSSLDWGQDLPSLKRWLEEHNPAGRNRNAVYLEYFGSVDPKCYGVEAEPLDLAERYARKLPPPGPGIYCVSATSLQAVYLPAGGNWTSVHEQSYQAAIAMERRLEQRDQTEMEKVVGTPELLDLMIRRRQLATARLLAYLRQREPDDQIRYTILVYWLGKEQLMEALYGPPPGAPGPRGGF
jgi:hypothetical protein